jgi:hypothetical protein
LHVGAAAAVQTFAPGERLRLNKTDMRSRHTPLL